MMKPPSTAPERLPMPPSTAATNALTPGTKPIKGSIVLYSPASMMPATAASPEPTAKENVTTVFTLMPMSRAALLVVGAGPHRHADAGCA